MDNTLDLDGITIAWPHTLDELDVGELLHVRDVVASAIKLKLLNRVTLLRDSPDVVGLRAGTLGVVVKRLEPDVIWVESSTTPATRLMCCGCTSGTSCSGDRTKTRARCV